MRFTCTLRAVKSVSKMIDFYSQFSPSSLSIKQFIDFGNYHYLSCSLCLWESSRSASNHDNPAPCNFLVITDFFYFTGLQACERKSFLFLRKELPVRLANIMKEIHLLPENLLKTPSVVRLNQWYAQSFTEILEFEKADADDVNTLDRLVQFF